MNRPLHCSRFSHQRYPTAGGWNCWMCSNWNNRRVIAYLSRYPHLCAQCAKRKPCYLGHEGAYVSEGA